MHSRSPDLLAKYGVDPSRPYDGRKRRARGIPEVEFGGVIFRQYEAGRYYRVLLNGTWYYLHREVWEHYNGTIPSGYEVHHLFDDDKHTVDPQRLSLLTTQEHRRLHPWSDHRDPEVHLEATRASVAKRIKSLRCENGHTEVKFWNGRNKCRECGAHQRPVGSGL